MKLRRTLIDNSPEGYNMTEVLKECLKDKNVTEVYIATGFWDLRGTALVYDELAEFLSREGCKFRLLIGKDPYLYTSDTESFTKGRYDKQEQAWRVDLDKFAAQEQYVKVVQMLVDNLKDKDNEKFQIHIYRPNGELKDQFLHSKCYIFKSVDEEGYVTDARGIIGSSNFTQRGLEGNSELNAIEDDLLLVISSGQKVKDRKTHEQWFNEKWNDSVSWEEEFLLQVTQSKMAPEITIPEPAPQEDTFAPLTPYELYIKYLQMHFGDIADATTRAMLESYLPKNYSSIEYQMDAVEQSFQILRTYGGFFLSDVVGLGKTVVGLLIIKKFIAEASTFNREPKVLIIVPPAIRPAWEETIVKFDEDNVFKISGNIKIVTTGSIDSLKDDMAGEVDDDDIEDIAYDNYGMIVIDESHNFRNNETRKYKALQALIDNITIRGEQPFIALLSATPQNNSPRDLKNQIYLFELEPNKSKFSTVDGGKLDSFFADKEREFKLLRNEDSDEARNKLKELSKEIREKVLDHIVVRRTRTDIKKHYKEDSKNLKFPEIKGPEGLPYEMDAPLAQLFADTMTAILPPAEGEPAGTKHIGYYRYKAINYFKDEACKKFYEKRNLTVGSISKRLAKIMQVLLVKRLESSFAAFTESLNNLLQYTCNMIEMIENDKVYVCPDIDVNKEFDDNNYDFGKTSSAIDKKIEQKGGKNRCFHKEDFEDTLLKGLLEDKQLISDLCRRWEKNRFDPKMNAFVLELQSKLFNPSINNPHNYDKSRLVIFTEAKATQEEIARVANSFGHKVLKIDASNRKEKVQEIKENFDALSEVKKDDYDIIVTTEVLAEGVNLHRANVILNYDTPWNATRLMQRIGRVNRIGSKEDFVHVFNFYPSPQGNRYIKLVEKAYAKLQAFHTMFGEDSKVYSELEEISEAEFNHDFEGEESAFSQFFADLKLYKKDYPERYEFIKSLSVDNLGGQFVNSDGTHRFIIKTKKRSGIPIVIDANGEASVVSPLGFMQSLKEASTMEFTDNVDENLYGECRKKAIKAYNLHATHVINAADGNRRINAAKQLIKQINEKITSPEARKALKAARTAVENGNAQVIRLVNKCAEEYLNSPQGSLFTEEDNINIYVESMFSHIAEKATKQYGEPTVAMYEI